MPSFSDQSTTELATCDERLQEVFNEVIQHFDCSVLEGHRDEETQDALLKAGKTQLGWPNSNHNDSPSLAVDVVPYPVDWTDRDRFHLFAGYVLGTARSLGYTLRWGGDWNSDTQTSDNQFDDFPHFEITD